MTALAPASFLAAHLLAFAVLTATAWAAGTAAARSISWESRAERLAIPIALGLAILAHLGFLLGALGLLRSGVLIAVVVGLLLFFYWDRRRLAGSFSFSWRFAVLAVLALAPLFLLTIYPPTAFDETMYHLPFARAFARSGALPATPALRFPVFPALGELLFAETLLLADDVATHLVNLVAALATAGLLLAWGRRAFSPWAGRLAAALWLGNPIVVYLGGTAYVDPLLALFVTGALFSSWMYLHSDRPRERIWLLLAAAFAGTACGVKYLGLFFAAAIFVDLLQGCRKLSIPILFAFLSFVLIVPTHARIAAQTGNPIFPYLPDVFGSTAWDPIAMKSAEDVFAPATLVRLARIPWDVTFHRSTLGHQPPFSPFYLAGLPLLLAGAVRDPRVRRLLILPAVWLIVFLFLPSDSRYLIPILPPLGLALAGSIGSIFSWKQSWLAAACALAFLPGWLYAGYRIERLGPPPLTAEERDHYLARQQPLYPAIRELDRISTVAYAFHAESMKYFYAGDLYGDWIGDAHYLRFLPLVGHPEALHRELRSLGATHLLMSRSPGAIRPPETPEWKQWFHRVYEDPAAEVFALADDP
ncbi:MAG: glycosyltransferase family 39 protein [Acidobacteriota bacterium]